MSTPLPRANAWVLLVALAVAGCGIVPKKTEIAIHDLRPQVQADAAWPRVDAQLVVVRPNAERLIDGARIVVVVSDSTSDRYLARGGALSHHTVGHRSGHEEGHDHSARHDADPTTPTPTPILHGLARY